MDATLSINRRGEIPLLPSLLDECHHHKKHFDLLTVVRLSFAKPAFICLLPTLAIQSEPEVPKTSITNELLLLVLFTNAGQCRVFSSGPKGQEI